MLPSRLKLRSPSSTSSCKRPWSMRSTLSPLSLSLRLDRAFQLTLGLVRAAGLGRLGCACEFAVAGSRWVGRWAWFAEVMKGECEWWLLGLGLGLGLWEMWERIPDVEAAEWGKDFLAPLLAP